MQAIHPAIRALGARLRAGPLTRLVAFGSSNTERAIHSEGAYNWFDWLDLGLRETYGRVHHSINAGIGGETTRQLLARFERDVAFYQPHAVFVTIGGNDAHPGNALGEAEFRANLTELVRRIRALPQATPILQTYYSFDLDHLERTHGKTFLRFMDVVREVAMATDTALVDNLCRWEPLRQRRPAEYRALMRDPCHVNPLGNMVWGLDLCRLFGVPLSAQQVPALSEGLRYLQWMDESAA